MSGRGERDRGKERFWRRMLRRWRSSGGTVREFCARHGLSEPSFYFWRRNLAARDRQATARRQSDGHRGGGTDLFVPVRVLPTPPVLEVVLGGGRVVRVPAGFDAATLRQLLDLLAEAPPC